jgi:hypothetical protein
MKKYKRNKKIKKSKKYQRYTSLKPKSLKKIRKQTKTTREKGGTPQKKIRIPQKHHHPKKIPLKKRDDQPQVR